MRLNSTLIAAALLAALASSTAMAAGPSEHAGHRARALVDAHPGWANRHVDDRFVVRNVVVDADGTEHVRMDRTYRGLPVFGGDIVVHSRNGQLKSVSKTLRSDLRPSQDARLTADDAIVEAGAVFGSGIDTVPSVRKVVYARDRAPRLAWEVGMRGVYADGTPLDMTFYVDAGNGNILSAHSNVHTGKPSAGGTTTSPTVPGGAPSLGSGRSLMHGLVTLNTALAGGQYNLTDTTRGNSAIYDAKGAAYTTAATSATLLLDADNIWGNGTTSDRATVAADVAYGIATTLDYYRNVLGRNGVLGNGSGVKAYVHVGRGWANAAWYAGAMYFGDGNKTTGPLISLDIAGHEVSHGVTQAVAGLNYGGDPGGLNEATSDIFGSMVEFYANTAVDTPDYTIGERVKSGGGALRYMYKPSLDGGLSYDCYPTGGFAGVDPHYSSGPANHFFYLLAEGTHPSNGPPSPTCNAGDTKIATGTLQLAGIGRDAASRIWFRALEVYMTSVTLYPMARTATLDAARDLYGAGSAQYNAVAAAWTAVNVY